MAKSNTQRVGEVMVALKDGLGPFVLREYKMFHRAARYLQEVESTLTSSAYSAPHLPDEQTALEAIDVQGWLNLMWRQWNDVFRNKLGHSERSYVSELLEARNAWAHQNAFANDDAQRVADTATRLLRAINATEQADTTQQIMYEIRRIQYEQEQKRSLKQTSRLDEAPMTTKAGLKAWRYVVEPHPDVASGRYIQAEFAADLAQVTKGEATPEYGDPLEFFRRTYLTQGLIDLIANGLKRLNGLGGDPVVQLQTSFGGGKTHSMLALYHLGSGEIGVGQIPGGEQIMEKVGDVDDRIEARRAVIVGTSFSATNPRKYDAVTTRTMWGDMAYQVGGLEAYEIFRDADVAGVSPSSDDIKLLLERYGPILIIVDELVAFARNLYGVSERLPAGTFDAAMTFMQSLTEGVKRSTDSILLISIPDSDIEIGGEGGKRALEILSNIIGRIESVWQPITATESFEIVRRRLFSTDIDYAARDAVLTAFRDMYMDQSGEYPMGVAEGDYYRRMVAAYPIHPEFFDRLYQDWSTLERFQRTRGVLRLMASVIHELWLRSDQSLLIMPSSVPLNAANVRSEILRYLPDNWHTIVDTDIDGDEALPTLIDNSVPNLGRFSACRRVSRAIFMGSAPSVSEQSVRGLEEVRIYLATVQPGEPTATFGDALRRMSNQLTYLYTDSNRYWYDTRPTVNRIAQDRAQNVHEDLVFEEQIRRLRKVHYDREQFTGAHVAPLDTADVADEWQVRVVVLDPSSTHKRSNDSDALNNAQSILEYRGNSPRIYRNMLLFIAPDSERAEAFERAVREYLAWQSINEQEEELNLDAQQRKQVRLNLERTDETVDLRLQETYSWLLVPVQPDPQGGKIEFQEHRISGQDNFYDRAYKKLFQSEQLIPRWSPFNLNIELERYLWRDEPHLGIKQLWEYLASYCYLPRLFNQDVLLDAISDGIAAANAPFAFAEGVDEDGTYAGLKYQETGRVYFDAHALIVRPEFTQAQLEAERSATQADYPESVVSDESHGEISTIRPQQPGPDVKKRYHGSVSIDAHRVNKEVGTIVEEIIERLTGQTGTSVEIRLEITATRPAGFDDATMRTVKENGRTLKFDDNDFEVE